MNGKTARKLRRIAREQTNQQPQFYQITYGRLKKLYGKSEALMEAIKKDFQEPSYRQK